jgi:diguanylate cyclase (GGDEF)-like protein
VLIEFADILKENFRTSDVIARIGGDEFAVMPVGVAGDNVELIRNRLNNSLEIHNVRMDRSYNLSVSAGVACYDPENPCSVNELLVQGDSLMYEEKKKKKET